MSGEVKYFGSLYLKSNTYFNGFQMLAHISYKEKEIVDIGRILHVKVFMSHICQIRSGQYIRRTFHISSVLIIISQVKIYSNKRTLAEGMLLSTKPPDTFTCFSKLP